MNEPRVVPPPWSAGDVGLAAEAYGWPMIEYRGSEIAGEAAWRAALKAADPAECEALRQLLPSDDQGEDEGGEA